MENCPYAYRQRGEVSLRCKKVEGKMNFCAHQYLCPDTKRWETTKDAGKCKIRKSL